MEVNMKQYIITIAREYASGGRIIGKKLADELGIAFYDKEIISLAAKESGISAEYIESTADTRMPFFMYNVYGYNNILPLPEQIYIAESNAVRALADQGSCVFIGRNASLVLAERKNLIKVFIHAPIEKRIETAREIYRDEADNMKAFIIKRDKGREEYSHHFSNNRWRDLRNYHLTVDSSIGFDETADVIKEYVKKFLK
jgi:cytidylate kinase